MRKRDVDGIMAGLNELLAYVRERNAAPVRVDSIMGNAKDMIDPRDIAAWKAKSKVWNAEIAAGQTIRLTDMTEDQLDVALFTQSAGTIPRDYQPVWYPTKGMLEFFESMATSADDDEDDTPDDGA